jgi:hypothetical protein
MPQHSELALVKISKKKFDFPKLSKKRSHKKTFLKNLTWPIHCAEPLRLNKKVIKKLCGKNTCKNHSHKKTQSQKTNFGNLGWPISCAGASVTRQKPPKSHVKKAHVDKTQYYQVKVCILYIFLKKQKILYKQLCKHQL